MDKGSVAEYLGREVSAGGVIFKRGGSGEIEVALISVKGGKKWGLPKGLKEEGENLARTAHREVAEETGLEGRILKKIDRIQYFYTHTDEQGSKKVFKLVYFFLMEYTHGDTAFHDEEVEDCRWFPIEEAAGLLGFDDEREVLMKARGMIEAL